MSIESLLQPFSHFGIKLGLEANHTLLAALGNPHQRVPILHVAGSNGKGSVCAYLSSVLVEAGYRVGRYTSPHLVDWTERICLNNQPIAAAEFEQVLQQVIAGIDPTLPSPTQFEVITAAAWLYFAQQQVDVAVIEVGLGGRLDATNVCDRALVSVITSLSLEHTAQLGPTLTHIAREKAGILKPHCPAVIGMIPPEAKAVVDRRIAELQCPAAYPEPATDLGNGWVQAQGITYQLPLAGAVQRQNSALAIAALKLLQTQGWKITDTHIAQGLAHTTWPARLQWFEWQDTQFLIDGAHNPESAIALRQYIDQCGRSPIHWVMGMLTTKDHSDIFRSLLRPGDSLYAVPVPDPQSAAPDRLLHQAQHLVPQLQATHAEHDVMVGLQQALHISRSEPSSLVVLCGSLYLIGHFFQCLSQATPVPFGSNFSRKSS